MRQDFLKKGIRYLFDKNYRERINSYYGKYDSMDDENI